MANSHKRDANARRRPRAAFIAAPIALVATAAAVAGGVVVTEPTANQLSSVTAADGADALAAQGGQAATAPVPSSSPTESRQPLVSRSTSRLQAMQNAGVVPGQELKKISKADAMLAPAVVAKAVRTASTQLWTTAELNLWTRPDDKAQQVGTIEEGEKVLVTGRSLGEREEIVVEGAARWVSAGYLSEEEPLALGGACTNGTSVPSGVNTGVKLVHEAVCADFPEISTYGTFRSDGEHSEGRAVDIMVSGERGWEIANFLRENYAALEIEYIIYAQRIWSVERSGEGWRGMSDRGSTTANHYDHVHVTVY